MSWEQVVLVLIVIIIGSALGLLVVKLFTPLTSKKDLEKLKKHSVWEYTVYPRNPFEDPIHDKVKIIDVRRSDVTGEWWVQYVYWLDKRQVWGDKQHTDEVWRFLDLYHESIE